MSKNIDERVVEMRFDNKQFEQGVGTSLKSIDALKKGLDLDGASKSLSNLEKVGRGFSLSGIATGVDTLNQKFSALGIVGITAIQNITNSAINAGKQMIKSLTVDPIKMGLQEYETKMGAIQTILTNTASKGTTLKDVNATLNELNEYSDKTIYNFAEMARNIGTFTAAGVGLKESAVAIKGIANLAAGSGSSSEQASTAMYQLSQALAAGSVKLQDWNSVVNAGMGGELFQNALKETAKQMGIVVDAGKPFRETLQDGWITSEVLTRTLAKFAEDESLVQAATQVKTFTQLLDTMKESIQSGWAQSWEAIIGDKEEAAAFFTSINNGFGELIGKSIEARNEMLSFWNANGGREAIIDALSNSFNGLMSVITPIKEAFAEIFPPMTGEKLVEISKRIKELTDNFKMGEETSKNLKNTFKGLFAVLHIGVEAVSALGNGLISLVKYLLPTDSGFLAFTGSLGTYLTSLDATISSTDVFAKGIKRVGEVLKPIGDIFKATLGGVSSALVAFSKIDLTPFFEMIRNIKFNFEPLAQVAEAVSNAFGNFRQAIADTFTNVDYDKSFDILNGGLFAAILFGLKKFVDSLTDVISGAGGMFGGITDLLDGVKGSLEAYQSSLKANTLLKIAGAIGILAASLTVLSMIDAEKLKSALLAMSVMFLQLFGSMALFDKFIDGGGFLSMTKTVVMMLGLSTAILILTGAMTKLSNLDWSGIAKGLVGIGVASAELMMFINMTDMKGFGATKGLGIIALATGILVLAEAVKKFSELDKGALFKGLVAVGVMLSELTLFVNATGDAKRVISTSIGLTILATSMILFADAIGKFGDMSLSEIARGLLTIAGVLSIVSATMGAMPNNMILTGTGLVIVSGALVILANALGKLGEMSLGEILKSLITLGVALGILSSTVSGMALAIPGALALLVIASSLLVLSAALKSLGEMSLGEIGKSLLALSGTLITIGLTSLVLTPLIPIIFALGVSMALLGVSMLAIGAGMLAFSAGMTALSIAGTAGAAGLTVILTTMVAMIPLLLTTLAKGIINFAETLADGATEIATSVKILALALIDTIVEVAPAIVKAILVLLTELLETIVEYIPRIVDAGMKMLIGFLKGISDNIGKVVEAAVLVVTSYLKAIADAIPKIIQAGVDLILAFINGMANTIRKNTKPMVDAINNLMSAVVISAIQVLTGSISGFTDIGKQVINGFINGIKAKISDVADMAADMANSALKSAKKVLGIHSPSREFAEIGMYADKGMAEGLKRYSHLVTDETDNLGRMSIKSMSNSIDMIADMVERDVETAPVIRPVIDLTDFRQGSKLINGMLPTTSALNLSATAQKASDASTGVANNSSAGQIGSLVDAVNKLQNESKSSEPRIENKFDIKELNVREEADIKKVARELYSMQRQYGRYQGVTG